MANCNGVDEEVRMACDCYYEDEQHKRRRTMSTVSKTTQSESNVSFNITFDEVYRHLHKDLVRRLKRQARFSYPGVMNNESGHTLKSTYVGVCAKDELSRTKLRPLAIIVNPDPFS